MIDISASEIRSMIAGLTCVNLFATFLKPFANVLPRVEDLPQRPINP